MDVMMLATRFIEVVTILPGFALQILTVMVIYRAKLFTSILKTFLTLLFISNMWFGAANFVAAILSTMEGTTLRFGLVPHSNSSFIEYFHFYVQHQSNHALISVLMSFFAIAIERFISTYSIEFHDAHFSKNPATIPIFLILITLTSGQIALQYLRFVPFTTAIELAVYCAFVAMMLPVLIQANTNLKASLAYADLTKKFQMKQNLRILKMIIRMAKLMALYAVGVVALLVVPSTFFPTAPFTEIAEGLFYMASFRDGPDPIAQGVFSMAIPILVLKDRAVRSSLRTFSIFRSTVMTVRVADASSTTSTMDPPNSQTGPNRYTLT